MDSEEIVRRVNALKLSSSNKDGVVIISADLTSQGLQRLDSCLVGKVLSSKAVNRDTFRTHMPRILQAKKPVNIEVVGENTFLLDFHSVIDRRHVLMDGPWTFFKDLVVFKAPQGLQKPADLVFDEMPIWVQCYNIPIVFMQSTILRNIGSKIGQVLDIEAGDDGNCIGRFARVRVMLDITKPLKQGIWVQTEEKSEAVCIVLLYERLPNFCFSCGIIGHAQRNCDSKSNEGQSDKYGNWLRAQSSAGVRSPIV
ncbi:uncharacterized protein At4g02000-like [Primulina tabacum]|uniref:uncharacterized protein At4g02000-like n=1 Tax=Primulina tabacum TaxID=48773 RepID=UPI003F59DC22